MMMLTTRSLALLVASVSLVAAAQAQAPVVAAGTAWSRATPGSATTGAVYLTLTSAAGDTLTGASSPAAQSAGVHEMTMDGTIMRMRQITALPLPPGQPVTLQPGGYHIMLVGLKAPLKQGQTIRVHLTFAKSAPLDITAAIAGIGAAGPPGAPAAGPMPGMRMP